MSEAERLKVDDFESKQEGDSRVPDPQGIVTRWLAEDFALADRTEKDWRTEVNGIWKKYRTEQGLAQGQSADDASFNILWSNTEIIVPALYNSAPTPDVRRRFKEKDPVGKIAATVLERGLAYSIDTYDFDGAIVASVLDFALAGRGVTRIRYRPTLQADEPTETPAEGADPEQPAEAPIERIVDQDTTCEHVQWNDFRRGPGKTWRQVPWVAFRHDMTYDDLVEYFGEERAKTIPLAQLGDDDSQGMDKASNVARLFQSGEVWEIWDRMKRRVLFIAQGVKEPLLVDDDPALKLRDFFPMPRPMYALLDSTSLVPVPLYRQYRSQAQEIDRLTRRIEKITYALRVRGAYTANVKEAPEIMEAGDNEFIAIEDSAGVAIAGLDKLIWIMPVEKLIQVLEGLYKAREQIKLTIYEIVGLSDIMRGATKATETLGAQELKSRWGSVRLQRMQKEVQRFVRDILRLKGEVIAEHYEPEVLAEMTQVQLPTNAQKQAIQEQLQTVKQQGEQVAMAAPQQGQPPELPPIPPEIEALLASATWEDVIGVLRSDSIRQYRVSIETDSTIADTIERDMSGMREVVEGIGAVLASIPTLQQGGAKNAPEVVKDIALAMARHARLGRTVEDSLETLEFGGGGGQMEQLAAMVQQIGQAVQQGTQQIAELGQKLGQHEQLLGQLVKVVQAAPQQPPQPQVAGPQPVAVQ